MSRYMSALVLRESDKLTRSLPNGITSAWARSRPDQWGMKSVRPEWAKFLHAVYSRFLLPVSVNRALRNLYGFEREEVRRVGENYTVRSFITCTLYFFIYCLFSSTVLSHLRQIYIIFPLALQPNSGLGRLHETFRFTSVTRSRTVCRTPWTGDQLVARPLPVHKHWKTHTHNINTKHVLIFIPGRLWCNCVLLVYVQFTGSVNVFQMLPIMLTKIH
jgi:hypothetical protein